MTPDVLASDTEREQVAETLRTHAAAGRLDPEELDDRLGRVFAARTRADLAPLVADLPAPAASPRKRREVPRVAPVIPLAILLVAIWALTGAGYFWPVWPIGAVLIGAFKHSGSVARVRWH
jgi:fatty acid desaturase